MLSSLQYPERSALPSINNKHSRHDDALARGQRPAASRTEGPGDLATSLRTSTLPPSTGSRKEAPQGTPIVVNIDAGNCTSTQGTKRNQSGQCHAVPSCGAHSVAVSALTAGWISPWASNRAELPL
jgi:hypothetical protein